LPSKFGEYEILNDLSLLFNIAPEKLREHLHGIGLRTVIGVRINATLIAQL
jgi:hypothetical protein